MSTVEFVTVEEENVCAPKDGRVKVSCGGSGSAE